METFFSSVGRSFTGNRSALPGVEWAILALLALVLLVQLSGRARRFLGGRSAFQTACADHGLGEDDVRWLVAVARRGGVEPLRLITHLDLFERATAQVLVEAAADTEASLEEASLRIGRLRRTLGFDRLPAHAPLLTSRELSRGTSLEVASQHGAVTSVTETGLTVEVRDPPALQVGQQVSLWLVHARDARYALDCPLRELRPAHGGGWALHLGHDEAPVRFQQREYARVQVRGLLRLTPVGRVPGLERPTVELATELADLSGGGAKVWSRQPLPAGMLALATFEVGAVRFASVRTVVLSCAASPAADGRFAAHLEFTGGAGAERERLVAALTQVELAEQAASRREASQPFPRG